MCFNLSTKVTLKQNSIDNTINEVPEHTDKAQRSYLNTIIDFVMVFFRVIFIYFGGWGHCHHITYTIGTK